MRRLAQPEDQAKVHAIHSHPQVSPFLTYEPMSLHDFGPVYAEMLSSGAFYVWTVRGQVAGFYRITRYPGRASHVALLRTLAVDPDAQGQGIARAMVEDALLHLRADGVRRVELYAEADNPRALRFYERLGFVREGLLRGFYRRAGEAQDVDEVVMGLLLPQQQQQQAR
ncbi:GNAT family N-acetyltransferase [Xenophilus arseniciresistens]|uniref:GNAT family N-acetyltransferase n=1 Tax=Xenophilus arseniciresistens TaxID=1283306 RepID=A0AAE3N4T4_9BURK|nr:GNAT family N-acetyltransferase [Xenophilus arseniciresistens]MDA7414923.1 GNAT family N-acetyltransferase [Xenophilus arseniciresistens]